MINGSYSGNKNTNADMPYVIDIWRQCVFNNYTDTKGHYPVLSVLQDETTDTTPSRSSENLRVAVIYDANKHYNYWPNTAWLAGPAKGDVGGKTAKTLGQTLAMKGKAVLGQAAFDLGANLVVGFGTWCLGAKMKTLLCL